MGSNVRQIGEDKDQDDPPNVTTTQPGGEIRGTTEGADPKLQPKIPRKSKPKPKPKPIKGAPIKKGLGALGEGKLNRRTGKPMKLVPRKRTLDEYPKDDKPSYFKQIASEEEKKNKDEIVEAHIAAQVNKDYFVEEIRANIIFEDKIAPLLGMIAGRVGQAVLGAGKKMAQGVKQTGKWLVTPQEEEEEY